VAQAQSQTSSPPIPEFSPLLPITGGQWQDETGRARLKLKHRLDRLYRHLEQRLAYEPDLLNHDAPDQPVKAAQFGAAQIFSGAGQEEWAVHYDTPASSAEYARAMAVDAAGNVYLTGYSRSAGQSHYTTVKYNAAGIRQWAAKYNGPDYLVDIAVDGAGNVYVAGSSVNGAFFGYLTIKYNPAGKQEWIATYNGLGDGNDYAVDLAIDNAGNVYVLGVIWNVNHYDYATIKYNAAGQQQWVAHYNGPGYLVDDMPSALAVDDAGNVYVTGASFPGADYATVKYNAAGIQEWVAIVGPGTSENFPFALAVDDAGNVYVTGERESNCSTVKYNSAGAMQWIANSQGPGNHIRTPSALVVDDAGKVYVTGNGYSPSSNAGYATAKYDSTGTQEWVAIYNWPGNGHDGSYALAVNRTGKVYVAGSSSIVKYGSNGAQEWVAPGSRIAVGLDGAGNVYAAGVRYSSETSYDYDLVKYDEHDIEQWAARHDESGHAHDYAADIAIDGAGNIYVTGNTGTIKYNSAGTRQWVAKGPGKAIVVDGANNVYVTGSHLHAGKGLDCFTYKYNAAGTPKWAKRYSGPGSHDDKVVALAADNMGNVYITGSTSGAGADLDYFTIKYNSAGNQEWVATYNGPANKRDYPVGLAVDGAGNVYVTGTSNGGSTSFDYATVKYNAAGQTQWVARYNDGSDYAAALAVDGAGNVYVTGSNDHDYVTVKYNSAGTQEWVTTYNGPANGRDYAVALAVDGAGNVYVTGHSSSYRIYSDYATVKYNSAGVQKLVMRYSWAADKNNYPVAIALDSNGSIYVTGRSWNSSTTKDVCSTVKYNCAGTQNWAKNYNAPGNHQDNPVALAVDNAGNVYVAGYSYRPNSGKDYVTIKYASVPAAGWRTQHIVDHDDVIRGVDQGDAGPRHNHGLALSPDEQYLYLSYTHPATQRLVRKIKLSETDPANNHAAVVAQLDLGSGAPAKALATDDKGRVYLARPQKIWIYKSDLSAALHSIDGFTSCEGVAVTRENGKLVVYATDNTTRLLKRFELTEGADETITASTKAGLDGDGEVLIRDTINNLNAVSPRGLDVQSNGVIWVADVNAHRVFRFNPNGSSIASVGGNRAMDVAIDEARGEVYVSQYTLRKIKVFDLNGTFRRFMIPAVTNIDLDGETGSGALSSIDVASCQRVFVANEKGRSILTPLSEDSPFSNAGDNNDVKAADTDPVLVVTGDVVAKESEVEESEVGESEVAKSELVTSYQLAQNYPNPFSPPERGFAGNPSTTMRFALPEAAEVSLKIYDIAGQLVQTLVDGVVEAGRHQVVWDGTNQHGVPVASGVYFYQLRAGEFKQVRKMSLLR